MQDTYYTPQHTGDSYILHKISAPKIYWDYVEVANEQYQDDSYVCYAGIDYESFSMTFKEWCAWCWERHFRDLEHIGFYSQQECNDSLPFVLWRHFWRDCDTHRWRHHPPNLFNDFFEVVDA